MGRNRFVMLAEPGVLVLVEVRAVEEAEAVHVLGEVRGHPVEEHAVPVSVQVVDQVGEVVGRAEPRGRREVADGLIAPAPVERMLADRHQLDVGEPQAVQVLHELMGQLERIDRQVAPQQVYLVVDSMTGQDAVNSAKIFNEKLELDGVIMTKLDGDARGGAALSVKQVTGVPIKFIGTGEHLDALEEFHPDRMAGAAEELRRQAEAKAREINAAYDRIKTLRRK